MLKAGTSMAARIAIIAMTTSSSISVKPSRSERLADFVAGEPLVKTKQSAVVPPCKFAEIAEACCVPTGWRVYEVPYIYYGIEAITSEGEGQTRFSMIPRQYY